MLCVLQSELRLLPAERRSLAYVFFPLVAGFVRLPGFTFAVLDQDNANAVQDTLNLLAQRSMLQFIFVLVRLWSLLNT